MLVSVTNSLPNIADNPSRSLDTVATAIDDPPYWSRIDDSSDMVLSDQEVISDVRKYIRKETAHIKNTDVIVEIEITNDDFMITIDTELESIYQLPTLNHTTEATTDDIVGKSRERQEQYFYIYSIYNTR